MKKNKFVILGAVFFLISGVLQIMARTISGLAEWYAVTIYPCIVGIYGRICSIAPFSVVEFGLYLLIIVSIISILFHYKNWRQIVSCLFALMGFLACLYTMNCGINYYRRPFSSYLELQTRESSVEELEELCAYLVKKINETAMESESGSLFSQMKLARQGQKAMEHLGTRYPQLSGYYPRPKPVTVSWILAIQQLCGIYSPFTVEANYNWQMTEYNIPHTLCHELSHLKGFMREDEANFIGYLACIYSEEDYFQYSGYLMGWIYAGNALAKQDIERYRNLYIQLPSQAVEDLQENNAYWNRYEGKVAEVSNQMNDTYLKLNNQEEGVQSYGRAVDLMLAYYREEFLLIFSEYTGRIFLKIIITRGNFYGQDIIQYDELGRD